MKKLITILAFILIAAIGMAQKYTYTPTVDTLTNSETVYFTLDQTVYGDYVAAFAVTADTLTGSNATVTVTLQELIETGKWVDNGSAVTLINAGDVAEKSTIIKLTSTPCFNYRLKLAQTGTATTKITGKFVIKEK